MATIFISYRRSDDPYAARSINDALCKQFGGRNIYFDLDALQAGLDWRKQIDAMVAQCDVMLVVIGDDWLQVDESGRSRLENEDDLVRLEVSSALNRDIPVIPVLVGRATIPAKDSLPEEIESLVYRQAIEVRATANFSAQIDRLLRSIEAVAPEAPEPEEVATEAVAPPDPTILRHPRIKLTVSYAIMAIAVIVAFGWQAWPLLMDWASKDKAGPATIIDTIEPTAKVPTMNEGQLTNKSEAVTKKPEFVDGQVFRECEECPEMVVIPEGSFVMGGSEGSETPKHKVSISSFALGKFEVTFDEYETFVKAVGKNSPEDEGFGRGTRPVINVSWQDAHEYVGWLSGHMSFKYRLPTEAEWEYSARAGTETKYWWGDHIGTNRANCSDCGSSWDFKSTAPVGVFPANSFGLHDMNGNVKEWVEDCWHSFYNGAPPNGIAWSEGRCYKLVTRNGSWIDDRESLRSAARDWGIRDSGEWNTGFRVARDLP